MLEIIYKRRSTRKFLDQKIEEEKIKKILTAALLAPSSKGIRPWEFIIVDDPVLLDQLPVPNLMGRLCLSTPHSR